MSYQVYWGDLHSHCSISYGEGTVEQALMRAKAQLDFCSVTGHAFWPDMPTDRERYGEIIDYHREGFARLAGNWEQLIEQQSAMSCDGEFIAFPSYEWHSLEYGDHNIYANGPELPLRDAVDLAALREVCRQANAIMIPHHIGYAAGYRGINWRHFDDRQSPFVEIFSLHGCSESEDAPYPMLHDMGPRDWSSTAECGWDMGHRFGVIASTDHHGGYPGSHGDGRVGVFAEALTRDAIWRALTERRVYAVTGDKIDARLTVDDAWIGSTIHVPQTRHLKIAVRGSDKLDRVELLKNDRIIQRFFPSAGGASASRYRLRVTWGWGQRDKPVAWNARLALSAGEITDVETCFSGQSIVAPRGVGGHTDGSDSEDLPHAVIERAERALAWRSSTMGNRSTRHSTTQAISLGVDAPLDAEIELEVNGIKMLYPIRKLLGRGHSTYLCGWLSEAIRVGPLVPVAECELYTELDDEPDIDCDRYRIRVAQTNGQWAWSSPIWVER
ncbi:MAG: hypothetical protein H6822_23560 [Planctomycetaceae bacterium]|nr:hypothetical protein [Planctomycetales bacterium]MCB9925177.1 hypothetical protein [Planctomycetaceae bacterium]